MAAQDPNLRGIMVDDLARGRRPLGGLGGVAEFAVDASGNVTGLVGPDGRVGNRIDSPDALWLPARNTFLDRQPFGTTRGCLRSGKMMCRFLASEWTAFGSAVLADHTGYDSNGNVTGLVPKTGVPSLLKVTPADDTNEGFTRSASMNVVMPDVRRLINGWFGLWVYVETQAGNAPGETTRTGSILVELSTTSSFSNNLYISFNTNQVREGWNFLVMRVRNPQSLVSGSGVAENHPMGVNVVGYGTGAASDVVANDIGAMRVMISGTGITGTNYYFDSLWTDLEFMPQFVIGYDTTEQSVLDHALPIFNEYGWKGYVTANANYWDGTEPRTWYDYTSSLTNAHAFYDAGWEVINHGLQHLPGAAASPNMQALTLPGEIAYEVTAMHALLRHHGFIRGGEFYISPQSSTSRLAEKVIAECGFVLQRHGVRGHTMHPTPWGFDNPRAFGSIEVGWTGGGYTTTTGGASASVSGMQTITKIRTLIDIMIDYGATFAPFSHGIITAGDDGSGTVLPSANNIMKSTNQLMLQYIKEKEEAGLCRVRDGFTGLWYGVGR